MNLKELLEDFINEGIHDKNTYKAVFLAGLPASGKTEFYNYALKHEDFKHLDSDKIMSFLVKRDKGSLKDTSSYDKYSEEIKSKLISQSKMWIEGGLGLVIDSTGQDSNKILKVKRELEKEGYDTAMVFIEKTPEESIEYSKTRERAVDKEYIYKVKDKLETNEKIYKNAFSPFIVIEGMSEEEYKKAEKQLKAWLLKNS